MKLLTTMTLLSTVAVHSATVTYLFGEVDFSSNEISTSSSSAFVEAGADEEVELFALGDVRLTGGPFQWAQHSNTEYLHSLDPDRLMSLMRRGAGLAPKSNQHYGGWDNWGS
ncbi:MAG: beta-L-arabinofuranosidase domain-containing protein, partial [Phycisphaerae bacterium]